MIYQKILVKVMIKAFKNKVLKLIKNNKMNYKIHETGYRVYSIINNRPSIIHKCLHLIKQSL